MYKAVKKTKTVNRYMKTLALRTGAPTVHSEENTSLIYIVEDKIVTPRVKQIYSHVCFLIEKFDNDVLFQHMRSLLLCRQICVPNHVQVQLSVIVLNG